MAEPNITSKKKKKRSSKKRKQQNEREEGADHAAGDMQDVRVAAAKGAVADHDNDEVAPADADTGTSSSSSSSKQSKKRRRKNKGKDDNGDDGADISTKIPANSFASVNPPLSEGILSAVQSYNFQSMTPVQSAVIPLFLTNKDVCVQAVTGSGKTLAFLIPTIEMILRRTSLLTKRQIGGLIISPTRELARQTHVVATDLCKHCSLPEPLLLVGGANRPVSDDLKAFVKHGSDIVVATPGRLDDVMGRYDDMDVSELEVLVLDEADVLLDMGFEVTLTNILARLPRMRRTGLFSATKPSSSGGSGSAGVKGLIKRAGMRNPVVVDVAIARATSSSGGSDDEKDAKKKSNGEDSLAMKRKEKQEQNQATPSSLTNYYLVCPLDEKLSRLVAFLKQHKDEKVIVFFLTCACVEFYGAALQQILTEKSGFYLETLHGKMQQKRREKAMERFRDCDEKGGALLCTDIAARGLDVAGIQWTVQFDAPVDPSSYVHRVGRSARAGATGSSLIFLTPKEESYVDFLRMRKVPLNVIPDAEVCAPPSSDDKSDDSEDEEKAEKGKKDKEGGDSEKDRVIRSASDSKTTIPDILPKIKSIELNDRDVLEKGTKAFTSYIRAYKEHQCAFIFRFASLDLGLLATSFCLLRLPKMPELKDKHHKLNFKPAGPEIDIHAIKFKDKVREKARQKRLAAELAAGGKNAKQIKAEQKAAEKIRRQKERRSAEIAKGRNPNKKRGKQAQIYDEWDELAKEERLHKKLRQGKITKEQFKQLMYGDSKKQNSDFVLDDSDIEV